MQAAFRVGLPRRSQLVVRGTGGTGGGKRVQIARARLKQWSPRVEERFLNAGGHL